MGLHVVIKVVTNRFELLQYCKVEGIFQPGKQTAVFA